MSHDEMCLDDDDDGDDSILDNHIDYYIYNGSWMLPHDDDMG